MHSARTTKSLLAALVVATGVAGVVGCAPQTVEPMGSTRAKLLAPKAVFKAGASTRTEAALGIAEWRIYRGKKEYVLTGYDKSGKAVQGVALGFSPHSSTSRALLHGRSLDGTRFSARHEFGGQSLGGSLLSKTTKTFVTRAVADLNALASTNTTGTLQSGACGGDMINIVTNAMQCLSAAGSATPNAASLAKCVAAATSASSATSSCQGTGTTGAGTPPAASSSGGASASSSGGAPKKSSGSGSSSSGGGSGGDKTDQSAADAKQDAQQDKDDQAAEDKAQDAAQDKADDQSAADAKQDSEQDKADDAAASSSADKAGSDTTCSSCAGTSAGDIKADDTTGSVSGVEEAGSTGAGDGSGDTSAASDVTEA